MEVQHGLQKGRVGGGDKGFALFQPAVMAWMDFDRHMDIGKMREAYRRGGVEFAHVDARTSWKVVFDRFREAKVIP